MTTKKDAPGSEGARRATGESGAARPERGRFSSRRKMAAVMRLLRGEDLDRVSRDVRVTAATLSEWREEFLAAGESGLKTRKRTPQDDQIMKLKAMIGELTMKNELLQEGLRLSKLPLAQRRSRQ